MKYYKAHLSNKESVVLDQQDFDKLLEGMNSGSFVKLKQAIINPSFLVMVLPIKKQEAMQELLPERKVEGYQDDSRGVYVITGDTKPTVQGLEDKFKE